MTQQLKGMLVGGLMPAVLFGITGLLQKLYGRHHGSQGFYLSGVGAGVLLCGGLITLLGRDRSGNLRGGLLAVAIGVSWGLGMALVMVGIVRYATPLAKLAPLYNMNTLIVSVLALVLFAEAREVAVLRLLSGAVLIVLGGLLVARA